MIYNERCGEFKIQSGLLYRLFQHFLSNNCDLLYIISYSETGGLTHKSIHLNSRVKKSDSMSDCIANNKKGDDIN